MKKRKGIVCIFLCGLFCIHSTATEINYEVDTQVFGEDKEPIVGALFSLYKNGALYADNIISDTIGNVRIQNITLGTYMLRQNSSMYGYQVAEAPIDFTIDMATNQKVHIKPMENKRLYGNVNIQLEDEKNKPLASFPISIVDKEGMVVKKLKSDAQGFVNIEGLPVGEYTIHHKDKKFEDQKTASFSITPYNSNTQYRITLHLKGKKNKESTESYTFVAIFVGMIIIGIGFLIYFFRKRSFTQFLDDFMV